MANRNWSSNKLYNMHVMMVGLDCNFAVGASGAVGTLKGPGIQSVTRLSTGTYQIQLQDNYNKLFAIHSSFSAPAAGGSAVTAGSFVVGTVYQIASLGTTNWSAVGLSSRFTPAVGMIFKATAVGSGTGTAREPGNSGIVAVEMVGNPQLQLSPSPSPNLGSLITVQCLDAAGAVADPANGSVMYIDFLLSNSSVTLAGE